MSVLECIWFASALFVWLCVSRLQHKCHSCAASLVFELRSIVSHPLPHDRQLLLRQSMADRRKNKRPVIASIVALSLFGVQDCIERESSDGLIFRIQHGLRLGLSWQWSATCFGLRPWRCSVECLPVIMSNSMLYMLHEMLTFAGLRTCVYHNRNCSHFDHGQTLPT